MKKTFQCNKCDFSAKSKGVLKHHKHLKHREEASLMCELCDYRKSNAPYLKSHMKALCQAYYINSRRFWSRVTNLFFSLKTILIHKFKMYGPFFFFFLYLASFLLWLKFSVRNNILATICQPKSP